MLCLFWKTIKGIRNWVRLKIASFGANFWLGKRSEFEMIWKWHLMPNNWVVSSTYVARKLFLEIHFQLETAMQWAGSGHAMSWQWPANDLAVTSQWAGSGQPMSWQWPANELAVTSKWASSDQQMSWQWPANELAVASQGAGSDHSRSWQWQGKERIFLKNALQTWWMFARQESTASKSRDVY